MGVYEPMSEREYRQRYHLPVQIERARKKLERYENRARRFGMDDLLNPERQA